MPHGENQPFIRPRYTQRSSPVTESDTDLLSAASLLPLQTGPGSAGIRPVERGDMVHQLPLESAWDQL